MMKTNKKNNISIDQVKLPTILLAWNVEVDCVADLKGCPFGQNMKDDCKYCDYGKTCHFDSATGQCVKRWFSFFSVLWFCIFSYLLFLRFD